MDMNNEIRKRKCHGNRKNQRFRKRCRARGMKPVTIAKLLERRNHSKIMTGLHQTNNNKMNSTTIPFGTTLSQQHSSSIETTNNSYKRKRIMSVQDLRANQATTTSTKKMKKKTEKTSAPFIQGNEKKLNKIFRQLPYSQTSSSVLLSQTLKNTLQYSFKTNHERRFIYTRLSLFDQHYCLQIELELWNSYMEMGVEQHTWPDQFYSLSRTDNFQLCHHYVMDFITNIQEQLNQCQLELNKQLKEYLNIPVPLERIDACLKTIVNQEREYLSKKKNNKLSRFKDQLHEKELSRLISTYNLPLYINKSMDQLMIIVQKEIDVWKELLMFETRIHCQFLPKQFDNLEHYLTSNIHLTMVDSPDMIQFKNQRHKIIQEAKRQWLNISLTAYENKIREYQETYQSQLIQLKAQLFDNTVTNGSSMYNDIKDYLNYQKEKLRNIIYKELFAYRKKLFRDRQRTSTIQNSIGVSPEPYLDLISNPFNFREWKHLSLGPSCIRSNQSAIRPRKQQDIEIKNEHKTIFTKVQNHLVEQHHIPRTIPIFKRYSDQLLDYFNHCYFAPLSYEDQKQSFEQAATVSTIRKKLKEKHLIIRLTDKGNNFYIDSADQFEKKAQDFFSTTNAFEQLSSNPFNEILEQVTRLLSQLASKKLIFQWHREKMMPDRTTCELAHLYFNPKTHKEGIPVRPIENTIHAATRKISTFLDQIIRPIFDERCRQTTIIDGASLITGLNQYVQKGLLKSSTLFCTFDIHNLYTMLPQDEALDVLIEFLREHGYTKVKGINLETIRELATIVLKENVFVYEKKIYKQILGGAMGSSFTLTLANIFMWKWQKELVRRQDISNEFYGRYIDDIFMTWNRSEKELINLLNQANAWHPNIKLDYKIGQCLPFLDVLITNQNNILLTSVYHKPAAEPYVTPFTSDHPRHTFVNVIQTALTRAIRYSSTFDTYQTERSYIKLRLLYNGYPSSFIQKQYDKFYSQYISSTPFPMFMHNEKQFLTMRNHLLQQPTIRQSQVIKNATRADIPDYPTDRRDNQSIYQAKKSQQRNEDKQPRLIIHYTHEKRFHTFQRDMHRIYKTTFTDTPVENQRLIVGYRIRRDAKHELIRKRPARKLLKNQMKPKRRRTTQMHRQKHFSK